jgi:uncharacterized caspase-like protein
VKRSSGAFIGIVASALIGWSATNLAAQSPSGKAKEGSVEGYRSIMKYAVLVGINGYSGDYIPNLNYAVSDATELYRVLTDPRRGGFQPENVVLLTDAGDIPPTAANIGKAMKRMISQVGEDDLVLVFFSGHGYEEEGRAYLLPSDADIDALDYTAIERDAFVRQIDKLAAAKVVVILDACHAGGISRGGKGVGTDAALSNRYYEKFLGSKGRAFIASCSGGQLSWEDDQSGHGVFTNSLVRGLSGVADTQPRDGLVTLYEIRRYLEKDVSDWARRHGKTQQPQINLESAYGDMPLALNMDVVEASAEMKEARRRDVEELKVRLVSTPGLRPDELATAVELLDRMAAGDELAPEEVQRISFLRRLAEGSIDLSMYRLGVRGIASSAIGSEPPPPNHRKTWFMAARGGGVLLTGDEFTEGFRLAPSLAAGYSFGRWALVGNYVFVPGELANEPDLKSFNAHLATAGPRIDMIVPRTFAWFLQFGIGSYFGSEIRNDRANFALNIGTGVERRIGERFAIGLSASWLYSNAALIPPSEPELKQGFYGGLGVSLTGTN